MDNFNFNNMQLAYHAIYDDILCESMDELGFFDSQDEIEEGYKKLPVGKMMRQAARKPVKAAAEIEARGPRSLGVMVAGEPNWKIKRALRQAAKMARVAERHSTIKGKGRVRGEGQAELNRRKGEMKEEYELYDLILEYLIDEGYVDSVEGALAILENMSDEWLEDIIEAREPGVKPYRPNPTQAEIRERQRKGKKDDDRPGWKDRSHIKAEGPLITARPGDPEEARKALKSTLPKGDRIMGPGFFPSRTADRVASITSSFSRGDSPGGGDPQATRMPGERKPRRVIPSRLDRKK